MRLYLLRHGIAESHGMGEDAARALTDEGRTQLTRAAEGLARLRWNPLTVLTSPRVRAHQTADIVAAALNLPVTVEPLLDFDFSVRAAHQLVRAHASTDLMLVGHEPTFSETIAAITGGRVYMDKGSLACIELTHTQDRLAGELVWLLAPETFAALR